MTYRTPENLIRSIMAGQKPLEEGHAPALKIPEPERVQSALNVLASNGIKSAAKKDDNTITIGAAEANLAADVLDRALMHGVIQAKPMMVSAEAIDVADTHSAPTEFTHEPHPPEGGQKIGEEVVSETKTNELEINQGSVDANGAVTLEPRSLVNRKENQLKKIDESVTDSDIITLINTATRAVTSGELAQASGITASEEFNARVANLAEAGHFQMADGFFGKNTPLVENTQLDELSKKTMGSYVNKAADDLHHAGATEIGADEIDDGDTASDAAAMAGRRKKGIKMAVKKLTKESTELNELSYGKIKQYTQKGMAQVRAASGGDKLDARIARRKVQIDKARAKNATTVSKAAFGESTVTPVDTVLRVLAEGKGLRLIATHNSECGKHSAKVYKDSEWGEHRVKFMVHGKHHEPADYHTDHVDDAHHTARAELGRLTKLNGALKEAFELGEDLSWLNEEYEQVDEVSKALLSRYVDKATTDIHNNAFRAGEKWERGSVKSSTAPLLKSMKRQAGVKKAVGKLQRENDRMSEEVAEDGNLPFDQVDEVSRGLLNRYMAKADKSMEAHGTAGDNYKKMGADKAADAHYSKGYDRSKYIGLAGAKRNTKGMEQGHVGPIGSGKTKRMFIDKEGNGHLAKVLAKEEVDQIDELSNGTLTNYAVKAAKSKVENRSKFVAKIGRSNAAKGEPEVKAKHVKAAVDAHRKMMNRHEGIKKAVTKLGEEAEQLDELKKIATYSDKSGAKVTMHQHGDDAKHHVLVRGGSVVASHHGSTEDFHKKLVKDGFTHLNEEVLIEAKKVDPEVEAAKKHLFKHPEADAIGNSIHNAIRHFNYSQDACDHVYSNHCKDVSYEDYHKMKPHLEATFKAHGLK